MTNRSFKAKLIGSEILRSIKERTDTKSDISAGNLELTKEKDKIIDALQARLVAVLEKEESEKDSLIRGRKREQSTAQKAAEIDELFGATNEALIAYRAAEVRHRAPEAPFGEVLDHHLSGLRIINEELDAERTKCPCTIL